MALVNHPFLTSLFPDAVQIIPYHNTTVDYWVTGNEITGNNSYFQTQWVQCSYQISGGYGPTPRYIFYTLIVISIAARRTTWVTIAAVGSVMIYSATAAIHALVLAVVRQRMAPRYMLENWEAVLVEGRTSRGRYSVSELDRTLWLPVLPMAWDNDGDAVLAIVGTAFLVFLPMQIWSSTLRHRRAKIVIVLWGCLLLMGTICALVNAAYIYFWAFGQLRFCPLHRNDTLPVMNDGPYRHAGVWDRKDWYRWNRTVADYFVYGNSSVQLPNTCMYPCFESTWPLRDPSGIYVVPGSYGLAFETDASYWILVAVYVLVISSGASSLTLATIASVPRLREWHNIGFRSLHQKFHETWSSPDTPRLKKLIRVVVMAWILFISLYTMLLSPIVPVMFVIYVEWIIWTTDPGGESFRHVGQWGAMVAAILVLSAALVPYLISKIRPAKPQGPKLWWRH